MWMASTVAIKTNRIKLNNSIFQVITYILAVKLILGKLP